ncbi:ABC transporter permease [Afipia sp. P52-10]|jgi:branched-chain amino acid transport system permease protein|uniref:branched-chain amino acid ABC transporter permease n=1 Tax=Afipia sp. P52-10 TaxID=1429916 RepID=UPI0003DEF717|nr:branched-chain amino acid ABC transporter permease [Afipia sp. P52-10]ETR75638.1 ABC transporter permease [Afipia sp. P52-10]
MILLQLLVNGLQLGAIYALTAVGFSLIFGSTKIFHVAHGSAFAIGGYVYWWCVAKAGIAAPFAALLAILAAAAFGLVMERFVYRPIQRHEASFFTVFIAAFGVQIIVQNLIGSLIGRGMETVSTPLSRSVEILPGLFVAPIAWISLAVALVLFSALSWFLNRTNVGTAMRALSENPDLVRVFGLDPGRIAQYAFMIGSAIVVPGAIFTAMTAGLNPAIGSHVMLVSLAATIVGGIGSVRGAACGGFLLGLAENLAYWKLDPQWSEAVTFIVLFLFIIFRPAGFFGRPVGAK